MTTNNSMTKIISKPFGALNVDVYQNDKHQYYMTREQIGRALECKEPRKYIAKIHERNADRLDSLSTVVNLTTVEGGIAKEREIICYSLRGVMEICRFSRQPKADAFMDFCWDIMESLMRGDSVLATPKMDAALSKEFIDVRLHALFDSMKSLQSELNSTRKDLSEQIEEARATSNEALNVIAEINEMKVQDVFRDVYEYMNSVYTFVIEEERRKYCARTGRTGYIPTIDVVEASTMYKSIFGALVEDLYTEAINKKKEKTTEWKALPEAKTIEAAPEVAVCDAPVIEVEVKEVESEPVSEEKPKKQSETAKILVPILLPLAEKLNDKPQYKHTYTLIYEHIGYKKMNNLFIAYEKAHGKAPNPKTKVFIENEKNLALFKKTVKQLMKE